MGRWGVALLSLLVTACAGTGDRAPPPLPELEAQLEIDRLWARQVAGWGDSQPGRLGPAAHEGLILVADGKDRVHAFDAAKGKVRWRTSAVGPVSAGPGQADGLVLVGTHDARVIAYDTQGQRQWQAQVSSEVLAPPRGQGSAVAVQTVDGRVALLVADDGRQRWQYEQNVPVLSLRGTAAPVFHGDKVLAGFANGTLAALDVTDGSVRWEFEVAVASGRSELERMVDVDADPLVHDGTVYAVAYQGRLAALTEQAGRNVWQRGLSAFSGLVAGEDVLYTADAQGQVWALDTGSGSALWKQDALIRRELTAPVLLGDYLVVGDNQGYLHWLRRRDGELMARYQVSEASFLAPPVVAGERLFAQVADGTLVALTLKAER